MGRPVGHLDAAEYHEPQAGSSSATVLDALADLRRGSTWCARGRRQPGRDQPARPRHREPARGPRRPGSRRSWSATSTAAACSPRSTARSPCCPTHYRALVGGFVINKLRGDPALLLDGPAELERPQRRARRSASCPGCTTSPSTPRTRSPCAAPCPAAGDRRRATLDVAVVRFPRIVQLHRPRPAADRARRAASRFVDRRRRAGPARTWWCCPAQGDRRRPGLAARRAASTPPIDARDGAAVLGICGGYQMLGRTHRRPDGVESGAGDRSPGLGWLDVDTTCRGRTRSPASARRHAAMGQAVATATRSTTADERPPAAGGRGWLDLDDVAEGAVATSTAGGPGPCSAPACTGCSRPTASGPRSSPWRRGRPARAPPASRFAAARDAQFDRLADLVEAHVDLDRRRAPRRARQIARRRSTPQEHPVITTPSCSTSATRCPGRRAGHPGRSTSSPSPSTGVVPTLRALAGTLRLGAVTDTAVMTRGRRAGGAGGLGHRRAARGDRHVARRRRGQARPRRDRGRARRARRADPARALFVGDARRRRRGRRAAGVAFARVDATTAWRTPCGGASPRPDGPLAAAAARWSAPSTPRPRPTPLDHQDRLTKPRRRSAGWRR